MDGCGDADGCERELDKPGGDASAGGGVVVRVPRPGGDDVPDPWVQPVDRQHRVRPGAAAADAATDRRTGRRAGGMREDFSESDPPFRVDVLDWAVTQDYFRRIVERDKVVVQSAPSPGP